MDMKKILQALDTASSKPVEGSNDMKKFLSVVTEGVSPHKVTLPVQMAMQHYAEPVVEKPKTIKEVKKSAMSGLLHQYYTEAQAEVEEEAVVKKELISEQARKIAERVLAKESFSHAEYDQEGQSVKNSLLTAKRAVDGLGSMLGDNDNLPEWCQEKISIAEDYLVTVWDYLQSEEGMAESRDKWDSNMPGHERYAGMGRGHDHRGLEQELAHETNNYAVSINGKSWKVFGSRQEANRVSNAMERKYPDKKIGVHATGAPVSEGSK